jgi:hypothetical protein
MSTAIGDKAAISFATAFYQALGFGRDVKTAFDLGCVQIDLESLGGQDTPKLLAIKNNPSDIVFVDGSSVPLASWTQGQKIREMASRLLRNLENFRYASLEDISKAAGIPFQRAYAELRASYDEWEIAISPHLGPNECEEVRKIGQERLGMKALAKEVMSLRGKIITYTKAALSSLHEI